MGPLPAAHGCDCHICRPDESYDDIDRRTIETVLEHGWQVISVADDGECCGNPDDHDHSAHEDVEPSPPFAYTIGLGHRCGHPELLMSGLDRAVMHHALNEVARRVMNGRHLAPGDVLEDVLAGVQVVVEQVADEALPNTVTWSAARESDEARGEDWSIHCGADRHDTSDLRVVHLAHLVRAAPSLRDISNLGIDQEAMRTGPDSEWAPASG